MKLQIDAQKLSGYCLNPLHPLGKHKARVFASALGLGSEDASTLKTLLLEGAPRAVWRKGTKDIYGQRWFCDIECAHRDKTATVRCAWITRANTSIPDLTTCYIISS